LTKFINKKISSPTKERVFIKIKIDPYLSLIGLEVAPSEWILSGLLAGHKASSLAALFIKRLFSCKMIITHYLKKINLFDSNKKTQHKLSFFVF